LAATPFSDPSCGALEILEQAVDTIKKASVIASTPVARLLATMIGSSYGFESSILVNCLQISNSASAQQNFRSEIAVDKRYQTKVKVSVRNIAPKAHNFSTL
jgi:hypothetical protein